MAKWDSIVCAVFFVFFGIVQSQDIKISLRNFQPTVIQIPTEYTLSKDKFPQLLTVTKGQTATISYLISTALNYQQIVKFKGDLKVENLSKRPIRLDDLDNYLVVEGNSTSIHTSCPKQLDLIGTLIFPNRPVICHLRGEIPLSALMSLPLTPSKSPLSPIPSSTDMLTTIELHSEVSSSLSQTPVKITISLSPSDFLPSISPSTSTKQKIPFSTTKPKDSNSCLTFVHQISGDSPDLMDEFPLLFKRCGSETAKFSRTVGPFYQCGSFQITDTLTLKDTKGIEGEETDQINLVVQCNVME